jgi:hypothetical protein
VAGRPRRSQSRCVPAGCLGGRVGPSGCPRFPPCVAFGQVMSASVKPRLAGRQPSDRGGVPRVMTGPAEQASAGLAQGKAPDGTEVAMSCCRMPRF